MSVVCAVACFVAVPLAQTRQPFSRIAVTVTPDRPDWTYQPGEPVTFRIDVVRDGHQVAGTTVKYGVGPEMLPPVTETTATVGATPLTVAGGTMKTPGFLRLIATAEIDGRTYRGVGTAGFAPERIQPTQVNPPDFDSFWDGERARWQSCRSTRSGRHCPTTATPTSTARRSTCRTSGSPRDEPAVWNPLPAARAGQISSGAQRAWRRRAAVPRPAGNRRARADPFQIGIHGIPVIQPQEVYDSLAQGGLSGYPTFGLDSRERYYYRRVYVGTLRANDFLTSLPQWDGRNLAVTGGSQGGALAIVTAGLDRRVTRLAAYYPALSDVTGYLNQRAGGWPHMFRAADGPGAHRDDAKIKTTQYYDVVNFARRVTAPGLYSWGFNDETCPPTSMYSAYNVITAPKRLILARDTGHRTTQEQVDDVHDWLADELAGRGRPSAVRCREVRRQLPAKSIQQERQKICRFRVS